ncbi:MAG TPA: glycoside hydrolase family 3 C-terminal domain-containing protein [Candidatus Angelobacter sp.]|nr:glycoside hydrolase family 3 C-terminal domain-containing protein [Candidatus Angelobacter sp.]
MRSQLAQQNDVREAIVRDWSLPRQLGDLSAVNIGHILIAFKVNSVFRKLFSALVLFCLVTQASLPSVQAAVPAVEQRVESILSRMTLEEKIDMLGGVDGFYIRAVPRLGLPRLKMADGPIGVRNDGPATAMAGGIALAATWDPDLAKHVGSELGRDARAKGVHFLLGPGVNIYRSPMNGRNFEYLGEDPFLASRIAVNYIEGVQSQGVSATIKHFMGNNSEFDRHNSDSVIDERTMREIYLPVFEAAVKEAHVGAVMDSYNLTNGSHMSENKYLNTGVLKNEWGFDGILMSDWSSTYDGVAAANSGLDLEMPSGRFMNRQTLLRAVQDGQVSASTIDDKVRRILRKAIEFGWLDREQTDLSISRYNEQGSQVALRAAREGIVLLKNDSSLLPLNKDRTKSIAVIGPDAYPAVPVGGGSARVQPFAAVSITEGLSRYLGAGAPTYYARGLPTPSELAESTHFLTAATDGKPGLSVEYFDNPELQGAPISTGSDLHINFSQQSRSTLPRGGVAERWTGYYAAQSAGLFDVFVGSTGEDGGYYRLYVDGNLVFDNWNAAKAMENWKSLSFEKGTHKIVMEHHGRSEWLGRRLRMGIVRHDGVVDDGAKKLAANADAVILAVGFDPESESEGADRTFRLPLGQEELIQEITAVNKNAIIVVTSGGAVDMDQWIDRTPAVLQAWYPGQEGGTALAEIVFGQVNPSGRLPVSFERRENDNPAFGNYYPGSDGKRVVYKEGVFVGYRGYERNGVKPLFPFGHGLSYTSFAYGNLSIAESKQSSSADQGQHFQVSFDVTNTGTRDGAEIAQVYVADKSHGSASPAKELKGFARVTLKPGEKQRVTVTLDERALSHYDVTSKQWKAEQGRFDVLVGRSAEQTELNGVINLPKTTASR